MVTNIYWYTGLAAVSFICAVYPIYKNRKRYKVSTLIIFYIFCAAIAWIGEFTVLGLFNAYEYRVGLFTDPWAQNIIAHLLLNTTMFPAAGILVVVYSLRFKGMTLIAAAFTLIEYIFLEMNLYEHHWWRYYMSVLNVFAFMVISRSWFIKMNKQRYGSTRATTYYFVAIIFIHTHVPLLLLFGKQYYQWDLINNLFDNYYLSSTIFAFGYHLIESFVIIFFICILKKWYWKMMPLVISPVAQILLAFMNILNIREGWSLIYSILIYEACIIAFIITEKLTLKPIPFSIHKK